MPMKNPCHPGLLVKADLEAMGLTIAEAAKGLGITRQQLYRIVNGECTITPEWPYGWRKLLEAQPIYGYVCR